MGGPAQQGGHHLQSPLEEEAAAERAGNKSIAVLYFDNLSGTKEEEYFRDGITEDIITELSGVRSCSVSVVRSFP